MKKQPIGIITHYFPNVGVAVLKLSGSLKIGDKIQIEGKEDSFEQEVSSMQIDRKPIAEAKQNQEVGLKVARQVKEGCKVFKL